MSINTPTLQKKIIWKKISLSSLLSCSLLSLKDELQPEFFMLFVFRRPTAVILRFRLVADEPSPPSNMNHRAGIITTQKNPKIYVETLFFAI
ncbi:unnamed protein product [Trifolium pratense]|uniref:Uncharacterized protein n=1 Tax=Trifolium pratense TaxID=57577 RepID=A0ACB0KMM5_TRIPR|nr:unnamed protein product [Trifolium pratense]